MKPLLIADTPWLLYRSYFALPKSIKDGEGRQVNALLGTVNALLAVVATHRPRAVVACFGSEQARYRVQLYPAYHAHRDPMPPELAQQWERAPALLENLGWTVVDAGELEADDAMGSLAQVEGEAGGQALLVTADRDLYQAVSRGVKLVELGAKGRIGLIDGDEVRQRYGVSPSQVPDLIALRGDPSDGLPGAPGVGAKTAAALLQEHGSLENTLAAAARGMGAGSGMTPRVAACLRENAELLLSFKRIATLQPVAVERPADHPTDFAAGAETARAYGMKRLAERLEQSGDPEMPRPRSSRTGAA